MPKPRNPYACDPLMRKGGVHQRSRTAERATDRQALLQEVDDYLAERDSTKARADSPAPQGAGDDGPALFV